MLTSWSAPGKVTLSAPLCLSGLYWTAAWLHTLHYATPSLPPCLPAPHSVCLSILGNVLCVQIEILGESFPDCLNFFFPSFFFISFPNLSLDFIPFSLLTPVILSAYVVCLSFSPSHTLFHISSWGRHSSIAFSLISLTSLPRSVSSLFHGLVTVRSTARDKCVWECVCVCGLMKQEFLQDRAELLGMSGLNFKKKFNQIKLV